MGKVGTGFSMSLDGFIADSKGDVGWLFDWYFGGDTDYEMPSDKITLKVSRQSAELLREAHEKTGALVVGRQAPDGRTGLRRHPHGPARMGLRRITLHLRHGGR